MLVFVKPAKRAGRNAVFRENETVCGSVCLLRATAAVYFGHHNYNCNLNGGIVPSPFDAPEPANSHTLCSYIKIALTEFKSPSHHSRNHAHCHHHHSLSACHTTQHNIQHLLVVHATTYICYTRHARTVATHTTLRLTLHTNSSNTFTTATHRTHS